MLLRPSASNASPAKKLSSSAPPYSQWSFSTNYLQQAQQQQQQQQMQQQLLMLKQEDFQSSYMNNHQVSML
jgi:hypothetical protein